jgi:DNA modification methylase
MRISKRMLVMPGCWALPTYLKVINGNYKDLIILHSRNGMTHSAISFGNFIPVVASGEWDHEARPNHLSFNVNLNEIINHPSPKPLESIRKLIFYYTKENEIICDLFAGSGTIPIVCNEFNRQWIAFEIDPDYYEAASKRIENYKLQLKLNFA